MSNEAMICLTFTTIHDTRTERCSTTVHFDSVAECKCLVSPESSIHFLSLSCADSVIGVSTTGDAAPQRRLYSIPQRDIPNCRSAPWQRIPSYLLSPGSIGQSQVRWNSSDSRASAGNTPLAQSADNGSDDQAKEDSNSRGFGFQSLSSLFRQPEQRPRYSRPNETRAESHAASNDASAANQSRIQERKDDDPMRVDLTRAHPSSASSTLTHGEGEESNMPADPVESSSTKEDGSFVEYLKPKLTVRKVDRPSFSRHEVRTVLPSTRRLRKHIDATARRERTAKYISETDPQVLRQRKFEKLRQARGDPAPLPNPFTRHSLEPQKHLETRKTIVPLKRPWGIAPDHVEAVSRDVETTKSTGEESIVPSEADLAHEPATRATVGSSPEPASQGKRLTHLTSSGEVHMVDVGEKAATKRVAIAAATVVFSNEEPYRLITENSNKKGDVLSVARVAGIMAAKRTSDLIPLCHPVTISKVEVDLTLIGPGHRGTFGLLAPGGTGVDVIAQVECTGGTGVEMESLTAVSTAALTIYDMCKAVDKEMLVKNIRLLYKAGGRSGAFCHGSANSLGMDFFSKRGLEIPDKLQRRRHERTKIQKKDGH